MTIPAAKDKPLFTPGPLTTSLSVRTAMLRDLGSRDATFMTAVKETREKLLEIAGVSQADGYEAVLMQGSGTFGVEAALGTFSPPAARWLIVSNGAYGDRMAKICRTLKIDHQVLACEETQQPNLAEIQQTLEQSKFTALAVVHCETTSGILNPIEEIGAIAAKLGITYFVDSMSAFGGIDFSLKNCQIDCLVSSANKCVEGVPGFSFAICKRELLERSIGNARSLSLDLVDQWQVMEKTGQFRFTPPTHVILAFRQALTELEAEGGAAGRAQRYRENHQTILAETRKLGFTELLPPELQAPIITSLRYPTHPNFSFDRFYELLSERGFVIYPGKVSRADCFRIGNIGRLFASDMKMLASALREVLAEMQIPVPLN